ncbi:ATP-binding protein [Curtobacterium sp. MCLR17_055]|uniref:AAA family ATPase n=1 Tax=Curtobacterium sp. MCLR17_055 TaxID=2175633 RepID=UPI000DA87889|nr:ATP-binding protein [Curtobacterium sp. MCLR17_055]PZE33040.1 ATP-binding protein [Curtobacterium sp. MCLR17_055]
MALVLTCGLSFSGKSTFAAGLSHALDAELLTLDRINEDRGLHGGQGIPLEEWATTNRIAHERAGGLLAAGRHVVVDDTGSPRFIRDEWRATASAAGVPFVLVWVQVSPELQRQRVLANREKQVRPDVTDAVLAEHGASFEAPVEEDPLVIDATSTSDPAIIAATAEAIEAATVR